MHLAICKIRILLSLGLALAMPGAAWADAFDHYTNPILAKVPGSPHAMKVDKLSVEMLVEHGQVLPQVQGALVIVRTNEGRLAKLLVQPGKQKVSNGEPRPIVLIDRFVTYREGAEKAAASQGQQLRLFGDFRLNLDIGQVVPADVPADVRHVVGEQGSYLELVGKAEMYLVTSPLPEAAPKKAAQPQIGAAFEPHYFNGKYKLYDDGRRSGTLELTVGANGSVTGSYYSDKDGTRYDVEGKVGNPQHSIQFTVLLPQTLQTFHGYLFTGDGRALTGTSRMQERETGFYALRLEE